MRKDELTNEEVKRASKSVWGASPAGTTFSDGLRPGTKAFFEKVSQKRSSYEVPWLYKIIPFASFKEKHVLEIGCGAGYDAYEICRNGAYYTGIDITPENIELTKKHLEFYGFSADIQEGDAEHLPFHDNAFDIVYSFGVLHHVPNIDKAISEAYRVLRKEGEFWLIVYHKYSFFYWIDLFLLGHILQLGFLKRSFRQRLSMIEYTTSEALPLVNVYSRNDVRKFLKATGFQIENLWVRKLDLPHIRFMSRLYQFVPQKLLDFIGKYFGWYIIVKSKK